MAVRFDAAADRLLRTTGNPSTSADWTVCFWIYLTSDLDTWQTFMYLGGNNWTGSYLFVGTDSDGVTIYLEETGAGDTGTTLSTGTWYHIAVVNDDSTSVTVFLDGVSDATVAVSATSNARWEFGAIGTSNTDRMDGRVACVKRFDGVAMTAAQILRERETFMPSDMANLAGWWPTLPGATERIADYSASGDTFTAGGTLTDEAPPTIPWGIAPPALVAPPSPVSDLSVSVSDALTNADTPTVAILSTGDLSVSASDALTNAEAATAQVVIDAQASDALTNVDSPAVALAHQVGVSDSLTNADAPSVILGDLTVSVSDALTVGESVGVSFAAAGLNISVSDGLTNAEAVTAVIPIGAAVSEAIKVFDTFGSIRYTGNDGGTGSQIDRTRVARESPLGTDTPVDVGAGDFTLECWLSCLYADNDSSGISDVRESNIYWDGDIWGDSRGMVAGVTRSGGDLVACFGVAGAGSWTTIYATTDIGDGEWHHVAVVRNVSTGLIQIYVDGTAEASDTYTTGSLEYPDNTDPGAGANNWYWVFGAEKHDADLGLYPSYDGYMTEARISDNRRYTTGFTPVVKPFGKDLNAVGLYHHDDASGTTLSDHSNVAGAPTDGEILTGGTPTVPTWETEAPFIFQILSVSIEVTASDALATGEAVSVSISAASDLSVSVSDALTNGEAVTAQVIIDTSASDSLTNAEATDAQVVIDATAADALTNADAPAVTLVNLASVSDALTVGETVTAQVVIDVATSDALSVAEGVTVAVLEAGAISITVSDALTNAEAVAAQVAIDASASDALTNSDAPAVTLVNLVAASDALANADAPATNLVNLIGASDTLTTAEAETVALNDLAISVSDSLTTGESVAASVVAVGTLTVSVSDNLTSAEAVSVEMDALTVAVSDALTNAEAVSISIVSTDTLTVSASDALTTGEALIVALLVSAVGLTLKTRSRAFTLKTRSRAFTLKNRS